MITIFGINRLYHSTAENYHIVDIMYCYNCIQLIHPFKPLSIVHLYQALILLIVVITNLDRDVSLCQLLACLKQDITLLSSL